MHTKGSHHLTFEQNVLKFVMVMWEPQNWRLYLAWQCSPPLMHLSFEVKTRSAAGKPLLSSLCPSCWHQHCIQMTDTPCILQYPSFQLDFFVLRLHPVHWFTVGRVKGGCPFEMISSLSPRRDCHWSLCLPVSGSEVSELEGRRRIEMTM